MVECVGNRSGSQKWKKWTDSLNDCLGKEVKMLPKQGNWCMIEVIEKGL